MNELLERILGLPRQQKVGIVAGVIIALIAADYFFLYAPQAGQIAKVTADSENARNERDKKKKLAANRPKLLAQIKELDVMLKEAVAQLPDRKEIPELLSSVSTKARESGLEIMVFRPRGESLQEFYAEIPVDIVVRGGFHNLVTFFDEVGRLKRLVNIQNIEIKIPTAKGASGVETATRATTFRFLDEAERARAAAQRAAAAKAKKK